MEGGNKEITAGWVDILIQSGISTERYFKAARKTLEESGLKFKTSDIIALASLAASDYRSASISIAAQRLADAVEGSKESECPTSGIAVRHSFRDVGLTAPVGVAIIQEET